MKRVKGLRSWNRGSLMKDVHKPKGSKERKSKGFLTSKEENQLRQVWEWL
jgi:hypothetical protein